MSLSSHDFHLGLGVQTPRPDVAVTVVRPAPFAVPQVSDEPAGTFRPMVFKPFDGNGQIVSRPDPAPEPIPEPTPTLADLSVELLEHVEVVEAEEPLPPPPPPSFEALKAEAWEEGYQQGFGEGMRAAVQEQQAITTRLGALLHDVAADNEGFLRGLESQVVDLALAIAEKVVSREVTLDKQIVLDVVRSALSEVHDATDLRIRCHPDDVAILEPRWAGMLPRSVAERSELVPDDLVQQGGVVVETRIGYIDSQLKTRLNQVASAFQGVLDGEPR